MWKEDREIMEALTSSACPSGYESECAGIFENSVKDFVDEVDGDVMGNRWGVIRGESERKIMLSGHMDEIGVMVRYIDEKGFIYFAPVGGVDAQHIMGQRVVLFTKNGRVRGVIGRKPIHLQKPEDREKAVKIEDMYIDIGAKDKEDAEKYVSIGDVGVVDVGMMDVINNRVVARAFDDKMGAYVVAVTLREIGRRIKREGKKPAYTVYGVVSVQEEIGLRGAKTAAYGISPDVGIAIDVTFATDQPDVDMKKVGEMKLGDGPVVSRGPNISPKVFKRFLNVAEKNSIPLQIEAAPRGTGTDANVIQLTKAGVATGLVSVPLRYMHSPVEMLQIDDLDNAVKLLVEFIYSLDGTEDWKI